ncbi:RecQ family ATP-dependent DNA helicase [Saxibacter everestensis]|uniref:DNA 3'-5' helicase n=2 Tax=Saxibacter everestensis TaxID=2909229 RepID=A0ABY8QZX2_9MICO|nr:RecQ family ATP-dependent DNA helicase [Brevibacteriaceae bacterium ZFBP1038]
MLRELVGSPAADFHPGQFEAVEALVRDRRRALVVQRTGWGKSAVYFVATLLLRRLGAGPSIIVSPLLALMRDQVAAAARAGVRAAAINSANNHEWDEIQTRLAEDSVDVLLVSPERLNNPRFRDEQLPELIRRTGLLVIDEAHCISDWGHDFRPDYRRLRELIGRLPNSVPVLATTATANSRVVEDVAEQLGSAQGESATGAAPDSAVLTIRGALARDSLRLGVLNLPDSRSRLAWLLTHLDDLPGSGIIYCLTVSTAEDTAKMLRDAGHAVQAYTGRTDPSERAEAEQRLKDNRVKALVATSALGMGFDKPDLGFVVHIGAPSSPVAYYQQVGRAGRATDNADVLLLPGPEDQEIWKYFATASMPNEQKAAAVLAELREAGTPLSTTALEARVDLRRTPLELLLKVLDVDGAVQRVSGGWLSTGQAWEYDAERYQRIAAGRVAEQGAMLEFERTTQCRMEFIAQSLDDATAAPCGRCDNCAAAWYSPAIDPAAEQNAQQSLVKVGVEVAPRLQWPPGLAQRGVPVKGKIPADKTVEEGRVLARLTDLGWGNRLREVFTADAPDQAVDQALLTACIKVLAGWDWAQRPTAIVSVPSASRPELVGSLATGLSNIGRLPYLGALSLSEGAPATGNSAFRVGSLWNRFRVGEELESGLAGLGGGPVLLVDDLIDSRWTMTIAGGTLRAAGAGSVLPFALALRG